MRGVTDYYKIYPQLPIEISLFFSVKDVKSGSLVFKDVSEFCDYYMKKYQPPQYPQPGIVSAICDILCENKKLSLIQKAGIDNINSKYYGIINEDLRTNTALQNFANLQLSCVVYGFKFIYENYKKYVLPVEFTTKDDDIALGSCFLFAGGIATARHCIEGAKRIAIQGISKELLNAARYQVHKNRLMDLVFIQFEQPIVDSLIYYDKAEVLDEVIAMGYPKIPGYHNFLTAEAATVSARFTASTGQIAAAAEDIWIREKLFLITAKIKGGNGGGPIIRKDGAVVGISANLAEGDGDYDDLGYGTVIPIEFLSEMMADQEKDYLNVDSISFKDFE